MWSRIGRGFAAFFLPASGALRWPPWMVVVLAGGLLGTILALTDTVQRVEWALYDRLLGLATRDNAAAPGILVVAIDEPSVTELGRPWPWPRAWHARLLRQLTQGGARAVVFDVVFEGPGGSDDDDRLFAEAIRASGRVVLASDLVETDDPGYQLAQWVDPLPAFADAAAAVAAARVVADPDGVVRRMSPSVGDRPSLALAAARVAGAPATPRQDEARLLAFNGPPRHGIRTVSYYQALEAETLLAAGTFKDQVVLVGRSLSIAPADRDVVDHYPTPVAWRTPGVEIHANALDALLRGRRVADPAGSGGALAAALLALALLTGIALKRMAPAAGLATVVVMGIGLLVVAWSLMARAHPVRVPVIGPVVTLAAMLVTSTAYRYAIGARERRMIRRAFQHYVSPAVVDHLLRDPSRLVLGGQECVVTVLFSDLEGFTAMSERLAPEEVRTRLSDHFSEMVEALLAERATLDKFIGDSVMAYFGAPVPDADHAARACRAALAMQRRMRALNARWLAAGLSPIRMRLGLNTGRVVAGNMGTATVFNYTVLGDTVNLASRLEGANKIFGTGIIVGPETRALAGDGLVFRELDAIRVSGRAQPVAVHELVGVVGEIDATRQEVLRRYAEGLAHLRSGDPAAARGAFEAALAIDPSDAPSRVMLGRVAAPSPSA